MNVLHLEGDAESAELLRARLKSVGFEVTSASSAHDAFALFRVRAPDVLITELDLEDLHGTEVVRQLRRQGENLPVLILSARGRWDDKVEGLEAGADDYLAKPFHFEELLSRIRAIYRRTEWGKSEQYDFGKIFIDTKSAKVFVRDEEVAFTRSEYLLLRSLISKAGQLVTKKELFSSLVRDSPRTDNLLSVMINRIRKKLEESSVEIQCERFMGYRLLHKP